ncbi:MAG TPA: hypothetical protein VGG34_01450 [Opitutaceae bacterium]|jgi:hypothetical protein
MSNWVTVTTDNLNASSVSGKVAIIRQIATNKGMPDPAPAAIATITGELRAVVGFSGKYALDTVLTAIPGGLLDFAVKKIVRDMSKTVGIQLTEDERTDEKVYEARVDKIRLGDWPIDLPDNALIIAPVQASTVVPSIGRRRRRFTHRHEEGS